MQVRDRLAKKYQKNKQNTIQNAKALSIELSDIIKNTMKPNLKSECTNDLDALLKCFTHQLTTFRAELEKKPLVLTDDQKIEWHQKIVTCCHQLLTSLKSKCLQNSNQKIKIEEGVHHYLLSFCYVLYHFQYAVINQNAPIKNSLTYPDLFFSITQFLKNHCEILDKKLVNPDAMHRMHFDAYQFILKINDKVNSAYSNFEVHFEIADRYLKLFKEDFKSSSSVNSSLYFEWYFIRKTYYAFLKGEYHFAKNYYKKAIAETDFLIENKKPLSNAHILIVSLVESKHPLSKRLFYLDNLITIIRSNQSNENPSSVYLMLLQRLEDFLAKVMSEGYEEKLKRLNNFSEFFKFTTCKSLHQDKNPFRYVVEMTVKSGYTKYLQELLHVILKCGLNATIEPNDIILIDQLESVKWTELKDMSDRLLKFIKSKITTDKKEVVHIELMEETHLSQKMSQQESNEKNEEQLLDTLGIQKILNTSKQKLVQLDVPLDTSEKEIANQLYAINSPYNRKMDNKFYVRISKELTEKLNSSDLKDLRATCDLGRELRKNQSGRGFIIRSTPFKEMNDKVISLDKQNKLKKKSSSQVRNPSRIFYVKVKNSTKDMRFYGVSATEETKSAEKMTGQTRHVFTLDCYKRHNMKKVKTL